MSIHRHRAGRHRVVHHVMMVIHGCRGVREHRCMVMHMSHLEF